MRFTQLQLLTLGSICALWLLAVLSAFQLVAPILFLTMPVVITDDIQSCSTHAYVLYKMTKESDPDDVLYARIDFAMGHFDTWNVREYIDMEARLGITLEKRGFALDACCGEVYMKHTAKSEDGHMERVMSWGNFMPRDVPKRIYMNDDMPGTQVTAQVIPMSPYEYAVARYQLIELDDFDVD
eukprot:8623166-Karenia_brevis.AAC.1